MFFFLEKSSFQKRVVYDEWRVLHQGEEVAAAQKDAQAIN